MKLTWGAFHSTKISENSGSKSNGTKNFRKFISKFSVHLSRLSFFLEIWKFRKFSVPFDISSQRYSSLVPLAVTVASTKVKMAASTNFQSSACLFTSEDMELFFGHVCVGNSENVASPIGKSIAELHDCPFNACTLLESFQIVSRHL